VQAAIARVEVAAKRAGVALGTISRSADEATALYGRGYQMVTLCSDASLVAQGAAAAVRGIRPRPARRGARQAVPRVREIDDPGPDPILQEVFAKERAVFGTLLNTTKVQAHCPGIMKAAKSLAAAVDRSGLLPPGLLALVYLRVALINGCPF